MNIFDLKKGFYVTISSPEYFIQENKDFYCLQIVVCTSLNLPFVFFKRLALHWDGNQACVHLSVFVCLLLYPAGGLVYDMLTPSPPSAISTLLPVTRSPSWDRRVTGPTGSWSALQCIMWRREGLEGKKEEEKKNGVTLQCDTRPPCTISCPFNCQLRAAREWNNLKQTKGFILGKEIKCNSGLAFGIAERGSSTWNVYENVN